LAAVHTARATHYRLTGEYEKALPDLDKSIQLGPSVDAYFQRGQVYAALEQWHKAIEDYDRSILERPAAPYVYLARSTAKRAMGDEEGYRQDQETALKLQNSR
jgi:tetratricopeptide (TPR) repeat protein